MRRSVVLRYLVVHPRASPGCIAPSLIVRPPLTGPLRGRGAGVREAGHGRLVRRRYIVLLVEISHCHSIGDESVARDANRPAPSRQVAVTAAMRKLLTILNAMPTPPAVANRLTRKTVAQG
jgi:hypothetical protein